MAVIRGKKVYVNLYDKWGNSIGAIELEPRVVDGLPSKGTRKGELVFNTQDSKIYYWDGSAWRTFGLEEHTHVRADITDFWATPFWDNIPDKPSTFPPEAHTHPRSDITDFWAAPFWDNIPDKPSMHRGFNYIVYEENGVIKAIDGRTGETLTEGTDPSAVISYVFQNISNGESVAIIGDFTIDSPLQLVDRANVKIFQWGTLTAGSGLGSGDYVLVVKGTTGGTSKYNELYISKINGNGSCNGVLLQDTYNNEVHPGDIDNVVKGITIRNEAVWSESNRIIGGQVRATQHCIGFEMASGASSSFVNTLILGTALGVYQYGIYVPSGARITASAFIKPHGWVNADNAVMLYLAGTLTGVTIISPYFEDVNAAYTGEALAYVDGSDFVLINPIAVNLDKTIDNPNNRPFLMFDRQFIYFVNAAPAMYGGIRNLIDSMMLGWRLEGSADRVLNIFAEGRTDLLYYWQELNTWRTIFAIYGDGRIEGEIFKAKTDLRLPTSRPANPVAGSMYFDPSTGKLYVYDGSTWKSVTLT